MATHWESAEHLETTEHFPNVRVWCHNKDHSKDQLSIYLVPVFSFLYRKVPDKVLTESVNLGPDAYSGGNH